MKIHDITKPIIKLYLLTAGLLLILGYLLARCFPALAPFLVVPCLLGALPFILHMNHQAKHLEKMTEMSKRFAVGDFVPRFYLVSDDEVGMLNKALHLMAFEINSRHQATLQEKERMETILSSMAEGVLSFDQQGRLLLMNKRAEEMLNTTFAVCFRHYILDFLRNLQIHDLLDSCLKNGKSNVLETAIMPQDKGCYRIYVTPVTSNEGEQRGAVMVLRNVTNLRNLEQIRTEFVANVSHELRTPLTSIKGYVETLLDDDMKNTELNLKFLQIIQSETDRMDRLINDLLYLSRLETGFAELTKKTIPGRELLDKVTSLLSAQAVAKKIRIETYIDKESPVVFGNQDMLEQVLLNLLENAIKYSSDGGLVRLEIIPHAKGTAIKVADRGIGIPPESLNRIFERFYRVDKARSRSIGGTGLGLSIVKHIVDRHRGTVQVESEENKGSVFTVILPQENKSQENQ